MAAEFQTIPGYEKDAATGERSGAFSRLRAQGILPLICLIVALVPVVAIFAVATPKYAMNPDDHIQQLYASGRFLGASAGYLMPYSLVPVSAPLSALYAVLPQVPWYPLMLAGLIVISYAVAFTQALRSALSDVMAKVVCVLTLMFEVLTTFYLTYTIVAFLAFGAGLMLVLRHATFERHGITASDVFGCLLVVEGYALRPESGLAALVVFSPFAVWVLIKNRNLASIVRGVVVLALIALTMLSGNLTYNTASGWEGYTGYLDAGRNVMDFPISTSERLIAADPDMSENDIDMLYDWLFIDADVFDTQAFEELGQGVDHYALSNLLSAFKAKLTYVVVALVGVVAVVAWVLAADLKRQGRRVGALAAGIALMFAVSGALLIVRARVRVHVLLPLIVMALFALIMCAHAPRREKSGAHVRAQAQAQAGLLRGPARIAVPVFVCAFAVAVCGGFWLKVIRPINAQTTASTVTAVNEYIEDNPDELIVFGGNATLMYTSQNALSFESWDCPENVLPAGSVWGTYTAPWKEFLARYGITNKDTLCQLAQLDNAVCIGVPEKMEHLRTYIEEHTGKSVKLTLVSELGPGLVDTSVNLGVYSFSFTE